AQRRCGAARRAAAARRAPAAGGRAGLLGADRRRRLRAGAAGRARARHPGRGSGALPLDRPAQARGDPAVERAGSGNLAARRAAQRARRRCRRRLRAAGGGIPRARRRRGDRLAPAVRGAGHAAAASGGLRAVSVIGALLRRDLALMFGGAGRGATLMPVLFFLAVAMLYPFAVGPAPELLARTGGGIVWVAALLASILPLDRLLARDVERGLFDQLTLRGIAEELAVAVRLLAHWLSFGPPLMLAAVAAAALLGLDA